MVHKMSQGMCDQCSQGICLMNCSKFHDIVSTESRTEMDKLLTSSGNIHCKHHKDKYLEIYCNDCELAVCTVCFLVHHKKHDGSEVTEVVEKLRKRIEIDIGKMDRSVERGKELESLHKRMKNLSENAAKSKNTILRRGKK